MQGGYYHTEQERQHDDSSSIMDVELDAANLLSSLKQVRTPPNLPSSPLPSPFPFLPASTLP